MWFWVPINYSHFLSAQLLNPTAPSTFPNSEARVVGRPGKAFLPTSLLLLVFLPLCVLLLSFSHYAEPAPGTGKNFYLSAMSPNWPQVTGVRLRASFPAGSLRALPRATRAAPRSPARTSPLARYPSQGTAIWTWHTAPGQYEDNRRPPWGRGTNEFQRQRKRPTDRRTPQRRGKRSRLEEGKEQREKSQGFGAFFVGL